MFIEVPVLPWCIERAYLHRVLIECMLVVGWLLLVIFASIIDTMISLLQLACLAHPHML